MESEDFLTFSKAWGEAVSLSLERRTYSSVEDIVNGLWEELGLDKFSEIVHHFLGRLSVQRIEEF